ncbi:MAG: hypothetical protein AAF541_21145 [Pseudomonadota bacterium]
MTATRLQEQTSADPLQAVFVPYCESILSKDEIDLNALGDLVPFSHNMRCVRLMDGTYEFEVELQSEYNERSDLQPTRDLGHAA